MEWHFRRPRTAAILRAVKPVEQKLLVSLRELEVVVGRIASGAAGESVLPQVRRIADLRRELPSDTDPRLLHFLAKNSYEKARLFLEGQGDGIPDGPGGHCEEPRP